MKYTAVVKFGGEVVADCDRLLAVLEDVKALRKRGWQIVICHGGGPQANALQQRLGLNPVKVGGRRVTDEATLQIMKYVLAGQVNVDVTAAAHGVGLNAVGISGVSSGLVTAKKRPPRRVSGGGDAPVDFGLVGDIVEIRADLLHCLCQSGYTPVVNTLGISKRDETRSKASEVYNINADTVASEIASALHADHLFLMTDVVGVLRDRNDPKSRIEKLNAEEARTAIASGMIVGGMIPKIEEALHNLGCGVGAVHICAADPGCLAAEADAPGSRGTVLG